MVGEYEDGASATNIASKLDVHPATVWRHLAKAGVAVGKHGMAYGETLPSTVLDLRSDGLTMRQIARRVGVSHQTISRVLAH